MVLGKRHNSLIKRTTSMKMITVDTDMIYDHASQPSDHLTIRHNLTVMATQNDVFANEIFAIVVTFICIEGTTHFVA
ncbi:unnamed protein product [Thlaspi arvense]|uniref:Uncharacterized protein n=1 Tax=Thlaspi arvense TaxID=13288 RepID=A0AAU9RHR7_THLAR|nr:unnamed protein product [Thlaspi arvense]